LLSQATSRLSVIQKEISQDESKLPDSQFITELGSGRFGFSSLRSRDGLSFVVKKLWMNSRIKNSMIQRERNWLIKLKHPCIVGVREFIGDSVEMDYYHNGSFDSFAIDHTLLVQHIVGIVLGMRWLHSQRIIHKDLVSQNILINSDNRIGITDFWQSRFHDLGFCNPEPIQHFDLIAPELHVAGGYSYKVDVFAFGIILRQILEVCQSEVLESLAEKCLAKEPDERPTFGDVYDELSEFHFELFPDVDVAQIREYALEIINGEYSALKNAAT
jgi:serine/threonine protein kinase